MIHLFRDCNLYIFIILLVLNFSDVLPEYIRYYGFMIALFIFAMSICKNYVIQNPLIKKCSIGVSYPFIFAILYSTLLLIIGENNLMYWASGSLMCFRMFCLIFMGYAIIAKYKWQSVDFLFLSCSIAYLVLTLQGVIQYGPLYVLNMAFNISEERFEWSQEGSDFNQIFEVHEFGLAMPLLALYYLLSSKQWKYKIVPITVSIVISLACAKRIALVAILLTYLIAIMSHNHNVKKVVLKYGGIALLLIPFIFLVFIYWGLYEDFAYQYEVDLKGRDIFYSYFTTRSPFSLEYIGHGIGYVGKYLRIYDPFYGIMGLHNDVLRIYIELGMIGSICFWWLMFNKNIAYRKLLNSRVAYYFILCSIYCLITYFTDNTLGYGLIQMANLIIPLTIYYQHQQNANQKKCTSWM